MLHFCGWECGWEGSRAGGSPRNHFDCFCQCPYFCGRAKVYSKDISVIFGSSSFSFGVEASKDLSAIVFFTRPPHCWKFSGSGMALKVERRCCEAKQPRQSFEGILGDGTQNLFNAKAVQSNSSLNYQINNVELLKLSTKQMSSNLVASHKAFGCFKKFNRNLIPVT